MNCPFCNSFWPLGPLLLQPINFIAVISANAQCQLSFFAFQQEGYFLFFSTKIPRDWWKRGKKTLFFAQQKEQRQAMSGASAGKYVRVYRVISASLIGQESSTQIIEDSSDRQPDLGVMLKKKNPTSLWNWGENNYRFFWNLLYVGKYNKLITERGESTDVEFSFKLRHCEQKGYKTHY